MANDTTGILSQNGQASLIDTVPEHSNSDLSGSRQSKGLFADENSTLLQDENSWTGSVHDWIHLIIESPHMIAFCIGLIVVLVIAIITSCVIVNICRQV